MYLGARVLKRVVEHEYIFVVHVFSEQARRFYDLERLWRTVPKLEVPDTPDAAFSPSRSEARLSSSALHVRQQSTHSAGQLESF